ncbi:SAM-dependent methyltransferase [Actinomadura luteofluorescens]|uniref:SAM-dependent methyltransferase n=2 Tax=Actinomadura luteofluorescens TaxID=46163 RepID=A0A7Y9JKC6_9ACTN|nr:SAM-dependent methyltransferase [Actinomadura luteofluorescens]
MPMAGTRAPESTPLALHRPGPARVQDYLLGGKDNYASDRDLAQGILRLLPQAAAAARAARRFLAGSVALLAGRGVRQFVDLGCGLPRTDNLHQMAAGRAGGARVVYVDHDPLVIAHARALLVDGGNVAALRADIRDPAAVMGSPEVRRLIDPAEPVALVFSCVLHFVPGAGDLVADLAAATAPGSALVVSHATADFAPGPVTEAARLYREGTSVPVHPRGGAEIARLLGPFRPLPPGVTPLPGEGPAGPGEKPVLYGAVAVR